MFGSRTHRVDSDADVAVILRGSIGLRDDVAVNMAGIAFDILMETGVLICPLPLWEGEWEHPEKFNNPELIKIIQREGVSL